MLQSLYILQTCVLKELWKKLLYNLYDNDFSSTCFKKNIQRPAGPRSLPQMLVVLILLFFHNKKMTFLMALTNLVQQVLNCVLIQRSLVMFEIRSKNHLLFSSDKQYTAPNTLLVLPSLFLTNNKDQHTNSMNQTQSFNPLVCKPENINSTNTLTAPRLHPHSKSMDQHLPCWRMGRHSQGPIKLTCAPYLCFFHLCLGFVWRLSDKWRSQGDRIHLSDRRCHCCRLQGLRAWCICLCECVYEKAKVSSRVYICRSEKYWLCFSALVQERGYIYKVYVCFRISYSKCVCACVCVCMCVCMCVATCWAASPQGQSEEGWHWCDVLACALGWFWCGCHFVVFVQLPLRHTPHYSNNAL